MGFLRLSVFFLAVGFGVLFLLSMVFTVQSTNSVPRGIYWRASKSFSVGDFVEVCPSEQALLQLALDRGYMVEGRCLSGVRPLIKKVVATSGDEVGFLDSGVLVNGRRVPGSTPQRQDSLGRDLERFRGYQMLGPGDVVLLGTSRLSFDSRYFGPVSREEIVSRMKLVWEL